MGYGVPQGSILGPTLFTLYINDLADLFQHRNIILYADDTVIYDTNPGKLQNILNRTHIWCQQNLLTVNCKKSQWMKTTVIDRHVQNTQFSLGTHSLDYVKEYKYLGLLLDSDLSFKTLRENLYKRVNLKI